MTYCEGVWLPPGEVHFRETLEGIAREGCTGMYPALAAAVLFANKRRRCLDIGAHIGLWSRWLVDFFEKVDAFEPMSQYAELYAKNVQRNNWRMHRIALGESTCSVGMKMYPEDTGRAHVSGDGNIQMRTLDSYGFSDVDLIKIDVEGYELPVVRGAIGTIRANRPIIVIEQRGNEIKNFGEHEADQALRYLDGIGMRRIMRIQQDWIMGWP